MDKYSLLTDAYFGTGLFENGVGLRQHPREDPANYKDRQGLAYYLNYTGPVSYTHLTLPTICSV